PHLVVVDLGEAVDEGRPPLPERLHLGAHQHEARLPRVLHVVVVSRLAVRRDELAPLLPGHPAILSGPGNRLLSWSRQARPTTRAGATDDRGLEGSTDDRAAARPTPSAEPGRRVHRTAVDHHREVGVAAGRPTRRADEPDHLAARDVLADVAAIGRE